MAKQKHARLVYLSRALDSLSLLIHAADHWLSPEKCDALAAELEPLGQSIAAKIEAQVPELVLPYTLEDDPRIGDLVEIELGEAKKDLGKVAMIRQSSSVACQGRETR